MKRIKLGKPHPKGYRVSVGFYQNGGKRTQKTFWLGHNPALAETKILAIEQLWRQVPNGPQKVWTPELLAKASAIASSRAKPIEPKPIVPILPLTPAEPIKAADTLPPPTVPHVAPADPDGLMLYECIEQYKKYVQARRKGKAIGDEYARDITERLGMVTRRDLYLAEDGAPVFVADVAMESIRMDVLNEIKLAFTSRPTSVQTRKPISIQSVVNLLQSLNQFFTWADKSERWNAPKNWQGTFSLNKKQRGNLLTDAERLKFRKVKPTFTLDELKVLYVYANRFQRTILLSGLMLGWTQSQLSRFRKDHPVIEKGEMFIDWQRVKTQVDARWWVCPELQRLFEHYISTTPHSPEQLVFLTQYGFPLIHRGKTGKKCKTDVVRLAWEKLVGWCHKWKGVRKLPYSRLRKCGAQIIKNLTCRDVAQAFLAHTASTVADEHYIGLDVSIGEGLGQTTFQKLESAQRQMYAGLKPMFDAPQVKKNAKAEMKVLEESLKVARTNEQRAA